LSIGFAFPTLEYGQVRIKHRTDQALLRSILVAAPIVANLNLSTWSLWLIRQVSTYSA